MCFYIIIQRIASWCKMPLNIMNSKYVIMICSFAPKSIAAYKPCVLIEKGNVINTATTSRALEVKGGKTAHCYSTCNIMPESNYMKGARNH